MPSSLDRSLIAEFEAFRSMSADELDAVIAVAQPRRLPEGTAAFEQGQAATEFFALLNGRLRVVQTTPEGQQVVIRHINAGQLFGLGKAMKRPDYPATAVAVVESLALAWNDVHWEEFISLNAGFAITALQTVGQRLQDAQERIRELATEEVERRIARGVLRLVNQAGRKTDAGIEIDFPVTREDIANMSASTLHTVSRTIARWQQLGIVASTRKHITVRDAHRLALLAEGLDPGTG